MEATYFLRLILAAIVLLKTSQAATFSFGKGGFAAAIQYVSEQGKCFGVTDTLNPTLTLTSDCDKLYRLLPSGKLMDEDSSPPVCVAGRQTDEWKLKYYPCEDIQNGVFNYCGHTEYLLKEEDSDRTVGYTVDPTDSSRKVLALVGNQCQAMHRVVHRFIAPGETYVNQLYINMMKADAFAQKCSEIKRRVCTRAEVCPNGPREQSLVTTKQEFETPMFIYDGRSISPTTCEVVETKDSFYGMCCPEKFPTPKSYAKEGVGIIIHQSGKCINVINGLVKLKDQCSGSSAALQWASDGSLRLLDDSNCLKQEDIGSESKLVSHDCSGDQALFQFTKNNYLQDLKTSRCLVPDAESDDGKINPAENTELMLRDECTSVGSFFKFQVLEGLIKNVGNGQCVAAVTVEGSQDMQLTLQEDCDLGLYKVIMPKQKSTVQFMVSGKCLSADVENSQVTLNDCPATVDADDPACFSYKGSKLRPCSDDSKCIVVSGTTLGVSTSCGQPDSSFHIVDVQTKCDTEQCKCSEGFQGKGTACLPINPCHEANQGGCEGRAICVYTGPGKSICKCPPGYKLDESQARCTLCPDGNCFVGCDFYNSEELKTALSEQDSIVLRFAYLKTSALADYVQKTGKPQNVVVYTQHLVIEGFVEVKRQTKLAIFAREVTKVDGAQIELFALDPGNIPGFGTSYRRSIAKVEGGEFKCEDSYFPPSRDTVTSGATLTIYQGNSGSPFTCSANYNNIALVTLETLEKKKVLKHALDVEFLHLSLACAKVMAQDRDIYLTKDGKHSLIASQPMQIIEYVKEQVEFVRDVPELTEQEISDLNGVGIAASDVRERLLARAQGLTFVPYLSLKAYEKLLVLLKDDAKLAIDQYERYRKTSEDLKHRIDATTSMTHIMTAIVRSNDFNIEAMKRELDKTIKDQKLLKDKLKEAEVALEAARKVFEKEVEVYKQKMIVNAVFSILGAITGALSGGFNTVAAIGEVAEDMTKFARIIIKIGAIMETIGSVAALAESFKDFHYDQKPYITTNAEGYYKERKIVDANDESFAVAVKDWDVMVAEAEGALAIGTAANEIGGTGSYLAALRTVAIWGKAVHEKSIAMKSLVNKLSSLTALQKEQDAAKGKIGQAIAESENLGRVNGELLVQMGLQKERLRFAMVDTLMTFCDSYFYNWMAECPVQPTLSDDLFSLHSKVNEGLSAVVIAVESFAPFTAQQFEATKVISNTPVCNKGDGKEHYPKPDVIPTLTQCQPIDKLKETGTLLYNLERDDEDVLKGYERVHVEELEVYLEGATIDEGKPITIFISFSGYMNDVFKGKDYHFVTPPRIIVFSYLPGDNPKIVQPGRVADKFEEYYDGISAMTLWSITVPRNENHSSLNVAGVTNVVMKFKGSRVHKGEGEVMTVSEGKKKSKKKRKAKGKKRKERGKKKGTRRMEERKIGFSRPLRYGGERMMKISG
ncbi:uncharacterized protein LOC5507041 isoform X1 [Nematostella vectensis]|uniref:uncharacterized protein LOC5507041 isoform X1 n=1 Tax=Nematostella vectensis TaxID=45351 RepID=UPI00138FB9C4|nr:uncharacterized protein LOC5507041 isoform X1 [Nematostella vectensis]XP_048576615.1 uncharacterized protein LOC5507041 isoform X1 [Nematostella vectensis]